MSIFLFRIIKSKLLASTAVSDVEYLPLTAEEIFHLIVAVHSAVFRTPHVQKPILSAQAGRRQGRKASHPPEESPLLFCRCSSLSIQRWKTAFAAFTAETITPEEYQKIVRGLFKEYSLRCSQSNDLPK